MKKSPLILGIIGGFGSGKSTASAFFSKKGFAHITYSSFLEEELKRTDTPVTRKALQDAGNALREQYGPDFLSRKVLEYISEHKIEKAVVDGIRNLGEIEVLAKEPHFVSLAIVVDRAIRFERLLKDPRREHLTPELFNELDYRDLGVGEKDSGLQTGLCIALADVFIDNNGTKAAFEQKLEQFLKGVADA